MSKILVSEASRRMGVHRRSVLRMIHSGRIKAEKRNNQWYVDMDHLRAASVLKEKPDLELQAIFRLLAAEEYERDHPGVERSWDFDPFPEDGRHKELVGV